MEQAGFVARQRDPDDERRVLITLTPHGRALREQAEEVPKELARRIEAAPDEIAHVRSVVQSLVGKLDEAV
jgi:DNA-binding MarR family transcriptional regulator